MGFLDSMMGELVRRETGFNATRLIRRIGSKRLLMMGGAALAGGMLAQKGQPGGGLGSFLPGATPGGGSQGGSASTGGNLPPVPSTAAPTPPPQLPPLPVTPPVASADALPPLPAEPEGDSGEQHSPELLYAIVRTMVAAALSDGALAMEEKAAIEGHLEDSDLTDAQQSQIRRDLVIPAAPGELAGMLPEGEDPEVLLEFAVLVMRADGELQDREMAWLTSLAELLGVAEEKRAELVQELAGDLFSAG